LFVLSFYMALEAVAAAATRHWHQPDYFLWDACLGSSPLLLRKVVAFVMLLRSNGLARLI
jgi:hypothetical protein